MLARISIGPFPGSIYDDDIADYLISQHLDAVIADRALCSVPHGLVPVHHAPEANRTHWIVTDTSPRHGKWLDICEETYARLLRVA